MTTRRIKVKGIRRTELDEDKLALAYWLMAKAAVDDKRKRQAEDKQAERKARKGPR